ncbi:MAG: CRISPR-associated protein Cas4 [Ignavibacteriota bacterium]|jgi:CRISPR-associated exonuclease Cas4|nr:MAG: CRISPR-associated protein Cas4 [Chlorobiota bacterium]MBE7478315.1 CRISPR-associated protein Cas4 [Ignavibacteriales bacterium]MBL1121454.1 CRISPR-associated protein Cas4 [Ignavibacteriota bacterium]MCE7857041.1 CRISPR-associated protein Cas4 [Ignavibacteria bacterium CHB3]MCL4279998.1 CRISPR-associated protein Cas4 [Ignavibacteriaceae bacterium]
MFTEDDFIMISALQHYIFCPRQCGLIHVDDVWQDNLFTVRGEILHEKVDTDTYETRGDIKTVRGLRIHSFKYGLVGRCDVVEFKHTSKGKEIFPVEFKAGEPKEDISDKVQLCAQVLCLEEMQDTQISSAAFFYGKIRRRNLVTIDEELRSQTLQVIQAVREIVDKKIIPRIEYNSKCRNCSLQSICQPKAMNKRKLQNYIKDLYS